MKQIFFITGTDTGVGKTYISCQLLANANRQGKHTLGLKPLAAGADMTANGLRNDDALALQAVSTVKLPYGMINPFCFAQPIAPHIAAAQQGVSLTAANIANRIESAITATNADYIIIEGAGGWRVPVNETETLADVVKRLKVPVILVVGMKLGCMNHALLTAEAIQSDGIVLAGWVANDLGEPMPCLAENIATLTLRFGNPLNSKGFI